MSGGRLAKTLPFRMRGADDAGFPGPGTIAAIYARKSTEQNVDEDAKSIARQVEHARAFAAAHGWIVRDDFVFVDDGISGADFIRRPGLRRLMAALPRPGFQVLIFADVSRFGRHSIETPHALYHLIRGGVRIFCYLEQREIRLDSPAEAASLQIAAIAADFQRHTVRQHVRDAVRRREAAGYATQRPTIGYRLHRVTNAAGQKSHSIVELEPAERDLALFIWRRAADGAGAQRICNELTERGDKPRHGGRWNSNTIRGVLRNPIYRGVIVTGRRRVNEQTNRTESRDDWQEFPAPQLRLVDDATWHAVQQRAAARTAASTRTRGARDRDSEYLLAGFARCGVCGGPMAVKAHLIKQPPSRLRGVARRAELRRIGFVPQYERRYTCLANLRYGPKKAGCTNGSTVAVETMHAAVIHRIFEIVKAAPLVERIVDAVSDELRPKDGEIERYQRELATLEKAQARLAAAVETGGRLAPLLAAMKTGEQRAGMLRAQIAAAGARGPAVSRAVLTKKVRAELGTWIAALGAGVADGRDFLRRFLSGPIRMLPAPTPAHVTLARHVSRNTRALEFSGAIRLRPFAGLAPEPPAAAAPVRKPNKRGQRTIAALSWNPGFRGVAA